MRCMERLFRRASVPLNVSEGRKPKPRMTFPLALAVGIEGDREVMELELTETTSAPELLERLQAQAPIGLRFESVEVVPPGQRKARAINASYRIAVPTARVTGLDDRIHRLLSASSSIVQRRNRSTPIDLRAALLSLAFEAGVLRMRLKADPDAGAGPRDVLTALNLDDLEHSGFPLARTDVEIDS